MSSDGRSHDEAGRPKETPADARLRLFLEHAPAAIAMFDRDMRYVMASRRYLSDYRLAERDIVGVSHYELFPEIPERWRAIHRRCLAGATERSEGEPFPRADGSVDWVRWEITPYRDDAGEIGGVLLFSELVTTHKRALDSLAAERERLLVTLRSIGDAVICTDTEARVTLLNAVAEQLTGWSSAEAIGRPLDEVFPIFSEETGAPTPNPVERVIREGKIVGLANHTALRRRDGTGAPIADSAAPIRDAEGALLGVVLVFRDQTREREAERKLRESEGMLRAFTDVIPDPIFLKDAESRWLFANPAALAVLGRPTEQVLGVNEATLRGVHADAEAVVASDRRVLESGLPETLELALETPAGRRIFLATKAPYRDAAGKVVGVFGAARDITDRKRAEEALQQSEARFRALIESSTDMIVVLDEGRRVTFWSPAATEALGWTAEEVLGRELPNLVHPDDRAEVLRRVEELHAAPGAVAHFVCRRLHKDGSARLTDTFARNLLHDPAVRGVVVNIRDITEQQRLADQFLQAQKLESIGRLAGGVAHDFNNLLTVILSCAESLAEDLADGRPAIVEDAQQIYEAGERARDLTGQLLAFARKQVIDPVALDLNTIVRANEKMLARLLGEDVELRVTLQPALWLTHADRGQLQQVLMNLAVNARDAMPRGGTLSIATRNARIDPREAHDHPDLREGDWVRLTVRDSGAGIAEEVRAHLFEPFFTTKAHGKGTGLGLSTVYGIVKQAGGHLHVRSEPGEGATFDVCLPRAKADEAPISERARGAPARGTESILLVEDDDALRSVIERALRGAGFRVLSARGAEPALALLDAPAHRSAPLDLLLTDVVMPGLDGKRLSEEVLRRRPGIAVLLMSGYTADVLDGHDAGGDDVALLPKPFTPSALLARVRRILDTGT